MGRAQQGFSAQLRVSTFPFGVSLWLTPARVTLPNGGIDTLFLREPFRTEVGLMLQASENSNIQDRIIMWQIINRRKKNNNNKMEKKPTNYLQKQRNKVWMCEKTNMFVDEASAALPCKSSTTHITTKNIHNIIYRTIYELQGPNLTLLGDLRKCTGN